MKKYIIRTRSFSIFLLIVVLFPCINEQLVKAQSNYLPCPMVGNYRQVVIIKADDYPYETDRWNNFFAIINEENICASMGAITASCQGTGDLINIKNLHNEYYINELHDEVNRYEFWNHGFIHVGFGGVDFDTQYGYIKQAQDIFQNSFGFESNAFGAPGNSFDQNTKDAIDTFNKKNNDQLKIWMAPFFSEIDQTGWNYINTFDYGPDYNHLFINISLYDAPDFGNGNMLYINDFIKAYDNHDYDQVSVILIQLHPGNFQDATNLDTLRYLIQYLKGKNALFVTPSYLYKKANNEHYCGDFYNTNIFDAKSSLSSGSSTQCNSCNYAIVHNNADISFKASKKVHLLPGFKSEAGSRFHAYINPVNSTKNAKVQGVNKIAKTKLKTSTSVESKIYPNPNNGIFTIDFGNQQITSSLIVIYDLYGHEIRRINTTSSKETIDLSNHPSGIYTVQVYSNKCYNIYKVVKK